MEFFARVNYTTVKSNLPRSGRRIMVMEGYFLENPNLLCFVPGYTICHTMSGLAGLGLLVQSPVCEACLCAGLMVGLPACLGCLWAAWAAWAQPAWLGCLGLLGPRLFGPAADRGASSLVCACSLMS